MRCKSARILSALALTQMVILSVCTQKKSACVRVWALQVGARAGAHSFSTQLSGSSVCNIPSWVIILGIFSFISVNKFSVCGCMLSVTLFVRNNFICLIVISTYVVATCRRVVYIDQLFFVSALFNALFLLVSFYLE